MLIHTPFRIKLTLEGIEEEEDEEDNGLSPSSWNKMTTTLEISMISANGYRSRHSQPEWGYALEPTQWTEYSIHTMDPDNLELTLEFFEVMCSSDAVFFFLWNFLKPDKKSSLYEVGSKCLFFSFLAFFTELTLISMLCNYGNHSKIYL